MKITAKYLLVALLACSAGAVQAYHDNNYDYANESRGCCFSSCYECGCNPLYCGAWDLQIHGGVNPITWRHRGFIYFTACTDFPTDPLRTIGNIQKFNHFFKTPWIVGGQVGYHWSDNARVYVEFNYSQAKGKDAVTLFDIDSAIPFVVSSNKYKLFDAYVGARYYWDRWCDRVSFFLGGKVGLTHHKSVESTIFVVGALDAPVIGNPFVSSTVVSGGADFGFDVCFCGNWSFVVTGGVIASCGPASNDLAITLVPSTIEVPEPTIALFGHIGTELRFPVTAGIRYSF